MAALERELMLLSRVDPAPSRSLHDAVRTGTLEAQTSTASLKGTNERSSAIDPEAISLGNSAVALVFSALASVAVIYCAFMVISEYAGEILLSTTSVFLSLSISCYLSYRFSRFICSFRPPMGIKGVLSSTVYGFLAIFIAFSTETLETASSIVLGLLFNSAAIMSDDVNWLGQGASFGIGQILDAVFRIGSFAATVTCSAGSLIADFLNIGEKDFNEGAQEGFRFLLFTALSLGYISASFSRRRS